MRKQVCKSIEQSLPHPWEGWGRFSRNLVFFPVVGITKKQGQIIQREKVNWSRNRNNLRGEAEWAEEGRWLRW